MFPEELPRRLIRMFSFIGETVLDPFLGSATTSLAAKHLERNSIGYEINESFLQLIRNKMGEVQADIFCKSNIEIIKPDRKEICYKDETKKLPYIFRDKVRIENKIDPRNMTFGSKIESGGKNKKKYLQLKRVIAPETIELKDNKIIRLIGIKQVPGKELEAIQWLQDKLKGQSFYLKSDKIKDDENNTIFFLSVSEE